MVCASELRSLAICGIEGMNVPDANTSSKIRSFELDSDFKMDLQGNKALQETNATMVRFSRIENLE